MVELFEQSPAIFTGVVFAFAMVIGSFLNVVIYRLPLMMQREWYENCEELANEPRPELPVGQFNLVVPRSRCPFCSTEIAAWQNIPVLSYMMLGGKCGKCKKTISARYPMVEFFTAVFAALCAWRFGFGWEALAAITLTLFLVPITLIDYDTKLIPDSIVYPLLWIGLLLSLFHPLPGSEALFVTPQDAIVGAVAGYLSLWSVFWVFKIVTGKDGMGYGDFKLLAAIGAWLGWQALPTVILMSAMVGAILNIALIALRKQDRDTQIPFGPYLAGAGWLTMIWGDFIRNAYLDLFL
ncbi:MAG: A24 family peptidase [Woeseiaceae bacterium]